MSQENIDYATFLEDLKRRRDAVLQEAQELDMAIAAISKILGQPAPPAGALGAPADAPNGAAEGPGKIRSDSFFGMSVTDAAKKYLEIIKRPASTAIMAKAIPEGGFLTTAKNFYANLYTALSRDDRFCNIGKGEWGLAEWYPVRPAKKSATRTKLGAEKREDAKTEGAEE